ncbi:MAG: hypothetical protein KA436_04910 [Oligoflexales bacterium]|nr:hypothetical protein [Oligoflexales bacterium]
MLEKNHVFGWVFFILILQGPLASAVHQSSELRSVSLLKNESIDLKERDTKAVLSSRELLLSPYQQEVLAKDLPASGITFDRKGRVWIAGKTSLWLWDLHERRLRQIELSAGSFSDSTQLRSFGGWVLIAKSGSLFQIDIESLKVFHYELTSNVSYKSISISSDRDSSFYWLLNQGVYSIHPEEKSLKPVFQHKIPVDSQALFFKQMNRLWIIDQKSIHTLDYQTDATMAQSKNIFQTTDHLLGVYTDGEEVYAHTKYSVIRFSKEGKVLQAIPVEGLAKIVLMHVDGDSHSYLLSNRMLEIYFPLKEVSKVFSLDLGRVKKASYLQRQGSMLALILDGSPRIFQLEGSW